MEEYIRGREATAGVVQDLRGEKLYALPPTEKIPPEDNAEHGGTPREVCPGNFSKNEKEELVRLSRLMHGALGLRHYSCSNFIVSPKGIYYLETDSLPHLETQSSFQRALDAVGVKSEEFFSHLINLARLRI